MVATRFSATVARIPIQDCKETVKFHYRKAVIITKLLKNTVLEVEKKRPSGKKQERKLSPRPCATHIALQNPLTSLVRIDKLGSRTASGWRLITERPSLLEAGSPKSRCEQGCGPSEGSGQEFSLDTWLLIQSETLTVSWPWSILGERRDVGAACPYPSTKTANLIFL
ncbi:hypothetical protein CapIbe_012406 [Capra ibex]